MIFKGKLLFSTTFSREARRNFEVFKGKSISYKYLFRAKREENFGVFWRISEIFGAPPRNGGDHWGEHEPENFSGSPPKWGGAKILRFLSAPPRNGGEYWG